MDRRPAGAGAQLEPGRRPRRRAGARPGGGRRAARPARRAGLQRQVRRALPPVCVARAGGARPLPDRPVRPPGVGAAPRLRRAPPARGRRRERPRRVVGGRAARRAQPLLQRLGRGRPRDLGRGRGDPEGAARPPQRLARARALGDRPRAHRHRLAVAAGRDAPQDGAHVQLADGVHGPLPGVPVRVLAGPAVRLDPRAQPRPLSRGSARTPRRGGGCRSAARGSSRTATCRRASRSSASSCTANGSSSASSAVAAASSGTPTCSATTASCRRSCAAPGSRRFLTQKLSWNRFNPPPHHTFTWQGIDGSEVLAHFPPADTYNATAEVEELRRSARDYKDHDRSGRSLALRHLRSV